MSVARQCGCLAGLVVDKDKIKGKFLRQLGFISRLAFRELRSTLGLGAVIMKTNAGIALLLGLAASASLASAQLKTSLELNKPYYCSNGLTVTVTRCVLQAGKEYCEFKVEQNGKVAFQGSDFGERVATGVKSCSTQAPTNAKPAVVKTFQPPNGKSFSPPYLSGMPSVEFVKSQIQGKDPTDTLARQVAVFNLLPEVIQRFQLADRSRYDLTLDEQKVTGQYRLGAYELEQGYKKTHSAAEGEEFVRLHGRYELDQALNREMYTKLFSTEFLQEYGKINKAINQWYQAHLDQERRASEEAKAQAAGTQGGGSPFIRNDPGTLAARRCVELGGNELECVGKGLWGGLMDLAGVDAASSAQGSASHGLVMNGPYTNGSGLFINFAADKATLTGCGKLVPVVQSYTLTKKPNQLLISVNTEPSSFVVAMGSDGKLAGPGPVDIKGQIIIGYHNTWMQEYRNGLEVVGGTCAGRCGYWVHDPIYAPKTERCAIGAFAQAPPPPPDKSAIMNGLESAFSSVMHTGPSGLRMTGRYTNEGGLVLDFAEDAVILDCGAAHAKQTYTIENGAAQILITVKNGSSPFTLALQPNGALLGSGSADVAGRVVTGANGNAITYASRNARCTLGTLTAKTGS